MTDTWAAKVLDGVPRHYDANCDRVILEADALAAIARMGAGDSARLIADCELAAKTLADTNTFETGQGILREAAARIAALTAQNQAWQRNSRETFDAMVAMRNSINEHLHMPSLESDLLQGPENSVFCAAVAEAVVREIARLRANVAQITKVLEREKADHRAQITKSGGQIRALKAKVARLERQIKDWEARIDECEWSANSSLTDSIRAEMRAALISETKP